MPNGMVGIAVKVEIIADMYVMYRITFCSGYDSRGINFCEKEVLPILFKNMKITAF